MGRPAADLPPAAAIHVLADAEGRIALRATPGARTEGVAVEGGKLQVKVRARPEGGAANEAVQQLLARALDLPPSRLRLLRGATSREKLFQLLPP